jgi:hypothetical protein
MGSCRRYNRPVHLQVLPPLQSPLQSPLHSQVSSAAMSAVDRRVATGNGILISAGAVEVAEEGGGGEGRAGGGVQEGKSCRSQVAGVGAVVAISLRS